MAIGDTLPQYQQLGLQIIVICFKAAAVTGLVVIAAISMDSVVVIDDLLRIHSYAAGAFLVSGIFFFALHLKYVWSLREGRVFRSVRASGIAVVVVVLATTYSPFLSGSESMRSTNVIAVHLLLVLVVLVSFRRHVTQAAGMGGN